MNRLTAIGLASLVAYGLLIASKYAGVVTEARDAKVAPRPDAIALDSASASPAPAAPKLVTQPFTRMPLPVGRPELVRASPVALEFRQSRDLKAFADALMARRDSLSPDERYHLAKALEECQFTASINEDMAAYAAKQRRQFLASLPLNDTNNAKRIAAYEAVDNTQRCARFQNSKISQKEIDDMFAAAAQEGDVRAQARLLVASLNKSNQQTSSDGGTPRTNPEDLNSLIQMLQTRDPEAIQIVGAYLSQSSVASQLRIGTNGEVPEPAALAGAFSLVACDFGPDCTSLSRDPQLACAYAGYCNAQSFEELYQNFLASPWAYALAVRYSGTIHTAINTQNWSLIGLQPPGAEKFRATASNTPQ